MRCLIYPKNILKFTIFTAFAIIIILQIRMNYKQVYIKDSSTLNNVDMEPTRYVQWTSTTELPPTPRVCDCYLEHVNDTLPNTKQGIDINSHVEIDGISKHIDKGEVNVIGNQRSQMNALTIGIPSIRRKNGYVYLIQTIESLIEETTDEDRNTIVVVIFLADINTKYNTKIAQVLQGRFSAYFQTGFLQIIQAPFDIYPNLVNLKHNYGDSEARVQWRAKQVIDYAILFGYAQNKSQYYLQLEDDVICAPNFVKPMKHFLRLHSSVHWVVLEFSRLGFIGKLFRNTDLSKLARFMFIFYQEQPVDWLLTNFRQAMGQKGPIYHKPSLFQHMGLNSSYSNSSHENTIKDQYFVQTNRKNKEVQYPKATLYTTMDSYLGYSLKYAYMSDTFRFFWVMDPRINDTITIVLEEATHLSKVFVYTGHADHPLDILQNGIVQVSATSQNVDHEYKDVTCVHSTSDNRPTLERETCKDVTCVDPVTLGTLESGVLVRNNVTTVHSEPIKCIVVKVTEKQENWVAFTQIGVDVY